MRRVPSPPSCLLQPVDQIADPVVCAIAALRVAGGGPGDGRWCWFGLARCMVVLGLTMLSWVSAAAGQSAGQKVLATTVPLARPTGLAFDAGGNLYLAETNQQTIVKVDAGGSLTTVAGTGVEGFAGDGGPAAAAMLDEPTGLAIDAAGNLFVADSHNQRVRRIDAATRVITTVAGGGTAGFGGDGGLATAAELNRPGALAVDAAGDLFIADTNNHRIRRVDAGTGAIATVAGDGVQGYAGDGGLAVAAEIDSPDGLAVSGAGLLYLADTHNQKIRVVSLTAGTLGAGLITTLAGSGAEEGSGGVGDGLAAAQAALAGPHGLALDAQGNLYVADTNHQRIRRIDAATGAITTVVGTGTQAYLGDGSAAAAAALDSPRAATFTPGQQLALSDTGNQRVRQVASDAAVRTVAGLGGGGSVGTASGTLTLVVPAVVSYGTGMVAATLNTHTSATGAVTFLDTSGTSAVTLGSVVLASNAASVSIGGLEAGAHTLMATYAGDRTHEAAASTAAAVMVRPMVVVALAVAATTLYGAPLPALTGSLSGLLPQDADRVLVNFSTTATVASVPGGYPITARLSGAGAGDYQLSLAADSGQLTVARAPVTVSLSSLVNAFAVGVPESFTAQVISTTSGTPTGSATLFDGSTALETTAISPSGVAVFTVGSLAAGTHSLTASYAGSAEYLAAASQPFVATVGGGGTVPAADFTLTAAGAASATVQAGAATTFGFTVTEQGGLASPVLLAASGLPLGAVATFSPAQVPPGAANTAVTLTIQVPNAPPAAVENLGLRGALPFAFAVLVWPLWRLRRRRWRGLLVCVAAVGLLGAVGCGDRVYSTAATLRALTYQITVNATATDANGSALTHSAIVLLTVE